MLESVTNSDSILAQRQVIDITSNFRYSLIYYYFLSHIYPSKFIQNGETFIFLLITKLALCSAKE